MSDVTQSTLLDAETWKRIEGTAESRGKFVLGVDLGTSAAMSAAVGYWLETGALRAFAVFPKLPDLRWRILRDGVGKLYQDMTRRGELMQAMAACLGHWRATAWPAGSVGPSVPNRGGPLAASGVSNWRGSDRHRYENVQAISSRFRYLKGPAAALLRRSESIRCHVRARW